jgi:hypothetical protein
VFHITLHTAILLSQKKVSPTILVALTAHHTPTLTSQKSNWGVSLWFYADHCSYCFRTHIRFMSIWNECVVLFLHLSPYNLTQLISRFACLSPKESKFSKWQDGNFTNNLTLLIFILFHDCWNAQTCCMYGCAFKTMLSLPASVSRFQLLTCRV